MPKTLAKAWGKHPPGTLITIDLAEVKTLNAVLVGEVRLAILDEDGFFAKPAPAPEVLVEVGAAAEPELEAVAEAEEGEGDG